MFKKKKIADFQCCLSVMDEKSETKISGAREGENEMSHRAFG